LDDWHGNLGLRGSGSNSVRIKDALIPKDFVNDRVFSDDIANGTPGSTLHGNPMYGGLFLGFAAGELACSQVGAAKAALAELEEIIRTSRPRFEPEVFKYQHHDWQRVFGLALSTINAAEAVLLRTGELYMEYCRANADGSGRFTMAEALQLQGMQHQAVRLSWEAGIEAFRAASTGKVKDGEPMQRFFRDLSVFRNNPTHQPDFVATRIAQAYFGLPIVGFDL
jgi:3-hydroxy-9,10-secoandrosta-1,3,5(10)-triene-9,17-dione monooxygenase